MLWKHKIGLKLAQERCKHLAMGSLIARCYLYLKRMLPGKSSFFTQSFPRTPFAAPRVLPMSG